MGLRLHSWAFIRRTPRPVSRQLMAFHRKEQMAKLKTILKSVDSIQDALTISIWSGLSQTLCEPYEQSIEWKNRRAISRFCDWLERYGETSYDHQSFYAGKFGPARQGSLLPPASVGHARGFADGVLRGLPAVGANLVLEAAAFPHRRRPLRHGLCLPRANLWNGKAITSAPCTSFRSFRGPAAGITRIIAGAIRSTGKRERAR